MKQKLKEMLACLLAVMMFVPSMTGFASAAGSEYTFNIREERLSDSSVTADVVYKLICKAKGFEKTGTVDICMIYDPAIITPINATAYNKAQKVTKLTSPATSMAQALENEDFATMTISVVNPTTLNNDMQGFDMALTCTEENGFNLSNATDIVEIYYVVSDPTKLNKTSIYFPKTDDEIDTVANGGNQHNAAAIMMSDKVQGSTSYAVYNAHRQNVAYQNAAAIDATLTYTGSDKDALTAVEIQNSSNLTLAVPALTADKTEETATLQLSATNTGLDGEYAGNVKTTWSIDGENTTGATINADTGVLSITNKGKAGTVSVKVTSTADGVTKEATANVTITKAAATATKIALLRNDSAVGAADTLTIPASGSTDYAYTAKVYDQFGDEMTGETITWTFTPDGSSAGVTHSNGTVTVTAGATKDASYTLKAADGALEATTTITVKDIEITWPTATVKQNPVYGDTWGQIVTLGTDGSASIGGTNVPGKFTVKDADKYPQAGLQNYVIHFASTDGAYNVDKDPAAVTIAKKPITVTATPKSIGYGDSVPTTFDFTVPENTLVGTDAKADLGLTLKIDGTTPTEVGSYAIVKDQCTSANYEVTVTENKAFTITKAVISAITTTAPTKSILADASENTNAAALKASMNLPATVTVTYGESKTGTANITWSDASETFNAKGGTYTYTGTLTTGEGTNFEPSDKTLTATLTVGAVTGTATWSAPATLTVAKSKLSDAADLNALLSSGNDVTVTYDNSVTDGPYNITGWTPDLDTLKGYDVSEADQTVNVVPTVDFPAWATISNINDLKTALTITNKLPVTVTVSGVSDITYGDPLGTPTGAQTAIADGTDDDATYTYLYEGVNGTVYGPSETAPTDAGEYKVTATLVSDTHSGSGSATFKITPKALASATIDPIDAVTYNGKPQTPALVVKDGTTPLVADKDYSVAYTDNTNAGTATATVTFKGNYSGTATATFTINSKPITAEDITISGIDAEYVYTGNAIEPAVTVKDGENPLAANTDYSVAYADNTNVGEATVTISGTGNYNGTATKKFQIKPVPLAGVVTITTPAGAKIETGTVLTANTDRINGKDDANLTYQWYRDGTAIDGATAQTYTVTADDENAKITVKVIAPDGANYAGELESVAVEVGKKPLAVSLEVTVTTAGGKTTLTVTIKDESGNAVELQGVTIVWMRNGTAIAGANAASYVITEADKGQVISAKLVPSADSEYTGEIIATGTGANLDDGNYTVPATVSGAPKNVTATPNDKCVTITWEAPESDGGSPITGYKIQMDDGDVIPVAGNVTSHKFENLTNGTAHTFKVIAVNAVGDSTASTITATPAGVPGAPVVTASAGDGTVTLTWTAPDSNGSAITGYTVQKGEDAAIPVTGTSYTFTGLTNNTAYTFKVSAVNAIGTGSAGTVTATPVAASDPVNPSDPKPSTPGSSGGGGGGKRTNKTDNKKPTTPVTPDNYGNGSTGLPFTDVVSGAWYYDAVKYMQDKGLMSGTSTTTFAPDVTTTRAMIVTILYRMENEPDAAAAAFPDVTSGQWYSNAVAWAAANNIVSGYTNGNFGPEDVITREQMAAILFRYASFKGYNVLQAANLSGFTDAAEIGEYAKTAMQWANAENLISGTSATTLAPTGSATRAQVASILMRFLENVAR